MRRAVCWVFVGMTTLHGLIHLMGAAKGLGWAEVPDLTTPVTAAGGAAWLVAAGLVLAVPAAFLARRPWWWLPAGVAAAVSQVLVLTAWSDARAGTLPNVVLLVAAVYGFAAEGPRGLRAEYRRRTRDLLRPADGGVLGEADLALLPGPVARYVRRSGAVGRPRVSGFHARIRGRIRGGPDQPWMPFTGEQLNTFGPAPRRYFRLDATMRGLPVDVLHVYEGARATMRARLLSVVPVLDAAGPEMDQGETVTVLNDLCLLAPAALVDAPVEWEELDDHSVRVTWASPGHPRVSAVLVVDDDGDLVDFVSDDRLRASPDGRVFTAQRWSTPALRHGTLDGRRLVTVGEGRWHAPDPEGEFPYIEFAVDSIVHGCGTEPVDVGPSARPTAVSARTPTPGR